MVLEASGEVIELAGELGWSLRRKGHRFEIGCVECVEVFKWSCSLASPMLIDRAPFVVTHLLQPEARGRTVE